MKTIIETLYPMNRCLLGEGYDNALEFLKHLLKFDVIEIPSGTELGTWIVPDEWIIRDAWIKNPKGEKILDYSKSPLSVVVGSLPFKGIVPLSELRKHWHYNDEFPGATPFVYKYYDRDWGVCFPKNFLRKANTEPLAGVKTEDGKEFVPSTTDALEEGEYEVFIDTEYKPGIMKLGVHTVPGKLDKEILLFAHLDHPFQANDNLSAVACLVDLATKIKSDYTIKIIICPETIGSTAYALTQDLSKVEFVIAVDCCGNKNDFLFQKSFNKEHKANICVHLALHEIGGSYRKGPFRATIGSDESVFNDPLIGIPGMMLSTWTYPEYHTAEDTPDKIDYKKIEEMQKIIQKTIEIYEQDFVPERLFKGMLMRSRYKMQSPSPQVNLSWDYLIFSVDGKRSIAELCGDFGLNFQVVRDVFLKLEQDGKIRRVNVGKGEVKKTEGKKHVGLSRKANVSRKPRKVQKDIR